MTLKTFVRALRLMTRRKPFRPFAIVLNAGTHFVVQHPELVEIHGDLIGFMDPKYRYRFFDSASVCELMDLPTE